MSDTIVQSALWVPAWFELDQTLVLGERQKYWFYEVIPPGLEVFSKDFELVFFNQLEVTENCSVRYAKIVELTHLTLGELLKVDADGLDYIFFPKEGEEIVVNAEEDPGAPCDPAVEIRDWTVLAKLEDISPPVITDGSANVHRE